MRLTAQEVKVITQSIQNLDPAAKIFLYGSRAQDHLVGGNIDLLVISEILKLSEKLTILNEIKMQLGDQKIDLTISSS